MSGRAKSNTARDAEILERRAKGQTASHVAGRMGVTKNTVIGVWFRAGACEEQPFVWCEENTTKLRGLIASGASATLTAATLDLTLGQVSGKAKRLGLRFSGYQSPTVKRGARNPVGNLPSSPAKPQPRAHPMAEHDQAFVTTLKLQPHHCRWPVGDPSADDFGYCGAQHVPGKPYCPAHCERAYVAIQPVWAKTGKALVRSLRRYAA